MLNRLNIDGLLANVSDREKGFSEGVGIGVGVAVASSALKEGNYKSTLAMLAIAGLGGAAVTASCYGFFSVKKYLSNSKTNNLAQPKPAADAPTATGTFAMKAEEGNEQKHLDNDTAGKTYTNPPLSFVGDVGSTAAGIFAMPSNHAAHHDLDMDAPMSSPTLRRLG